MGRQIVLNIFILLIPILLLVFVNEYSRSVTKDIGYTRKGIIAINTGIKTPKKCTWYCHKDTGYCKAKHTNLLKSEIATIDPIYFGIIKYLQAVGDYGLANIIFLVILFPLIIYLLLIKSISIQRKIKKLKNE